MSGQAGSMDSSIFYAFVKDGTSPNLLGNRTNTFSNKRCYQCLSNRTQTHQQ
jgi:hypothetical protein